MFSGSADSESLCSNPALSSPAGTLKMLYSWLWALPETEGQSNGLALTECSMQAQWFFLFCPHGHQQWLCDHVTSLGFSVLTQETLAAAQEVGATVSCPQIQTYIEKWERKQNIVSVSCWVCLILFSIFFSSYRDKTPLPTLCKEERLHLCLWFRKIRAYNQRHGSWNETESSHFEPQPWSRESKL